LKLAGCTYLKPA